MVELDIIRRSVVRGKPYEGAKKLGFLRGGKFVFENKDESSVLMDYCSYNVFRQGRNAIDEYISECAADHDSDEMACLHAMQHAAYVLRRCARTMHSMRTISLSIVKRIRKTLGCCPKCISHTSK